MNIKFTLFVHGVPKGQKIWGPSEQDRDYIGLSYGKYKDKPNKVLSVEINGDNSYYTYFVGQNVLAKDGRAGSYFALTLRINRYYADVKNIYNLLDAAYNKYILNKILKYNGVVSSYLIEDFIQVNDYLLGLEKEIVNYLNQFSSNTDLLPLSGFPKQVKSVEEICLFDCDSGKITQLIKTSGAIMISPDYPSITLKSIMKKKDDEIQKVKEDGQNAMKEIRAEYSIAEKNITTLKKELEIEKEKADGLRKSLENSNKRVLDLEKLNRSGKQLQDELKKKNDKLGKVEQVLPKISTAVKELSSAFDGNVVRGDDYDTKPQIKPQPRKIKVNSFVSFSVSLLNTILLIFIVSMILLPKSCTDRNNQALADSQNEIQSLKSELANKKQELNKLKEFSEKIFKGARIDVEKFSNEKKYLKKGEESKISLLEIGGSFTVDPGLTITEKGLVKAGTEQGTYKIYYQVGDSVVKSREIEVKLQ